MSSVFSNVEGLAIKFLSEFGHCLLHLSLFWKRDKTESFIAFIVSGQVETIDLPTVIKERSKILNFRTLVDITHIYGVSMLSGWSCPLYLGLLRNANFVLGQLAHSKFGLVMCLVIHEYHTMVILLVWHIDAHFIYNAEFAKCILDLSL